MCVEKGNVGNRLKHVFPKFHADRSNVRGVNGHSKLEKRFFGFRRRKIKCRESSETRFGQVSRRSEPSSRGKRPFKVCRVRCRAGFSSPTRVGDRFDLCRGIPYALRQACYICQSLHHPKQSEVFFKKPSIIFVDRMIVRSFQTVQSFRYGSSPQNKHS